jgi:hypothetical protein
MGASEIVGTSFDITLVDGRSSQTKIIKSNMRLTDIFIEVPVLATAKKTAKLIITTERGNTIFAINELDASSAKTYPIRLSKSLMGAITVEITTDAIVTGDKTFTIELRGYGWVVSGSAEQDGYYYAKLGSTNLYGLEHPSFRITEELNKIPSFEFEIANCSDNRTAIAAGITDVFRIYRRIYSVDTLMFTGIINGDAIEYLSLERIRITGYASYIDLNWRFHQHLNSEDAENVDKVWDYSGSYTDYTTAANNDTINDVTPTFTNKNDALYIGQSEQFFSAQVKYSTKGIKMASTGICTDIYEASSKAHPTHAVLGINFRPQIYFYEKNHKRTYFTWMQRAGVGYSCEAMVYYYDHALNTHSPSVGVGPGTLNATDAHAAPSIIVANSGHIIVAHEKLTGTGSSAHNSEIQIKKSDYAEDISSFSLAEETISGCAYPNLLKNNSGHLFLVVRYGSALITNHYRTRIFKSIDNGANWDNGYIISSVYKSGENRWAYSSSIRSSTSMGLHLTINSLYYDVSPHSYPDSYYLCSDDGITWRNVDNSYSKDIVNTGYISRTELDAHFLVEHSAIATDLRYITCGCVSSSGAVYFILEWGNRHSVPQVTNRYLVYWTGSAWAKQEILGVFSQGGAFCGDDQINGIVSFSDSSFDIYLTKKETKVEVQRWHTDDKGVNWTKVEDVTAGSAYDHDWTPISQDGSNGSYLAFSSVYKVNANYSHILRGIMGGSQIAIEYSKGSDVWGTLDVLDETRAFTEDPGTYFIIIPHKPSDWAKDTVNGVKKFWIRARLSTVSYATLPALDRIKITNIDVYRVYYFETAADTIMDEVLAGTDYSMDAIDVCPSDTISIVAEYETKLRIVAGIANALTWDDSGDKKGYQWWIDTNKKVHFKQKRGATLGDITGELTILNNIEDYFNLSNRLHFFGNYDGLNQLRAVIEDVDSQDTHEIRELAVPEERYNNYTPLKEAAQKAMTYTKAPLQKIAATVTTKYWLDNSFEVGDTVTLHATSWDVASQAFQIVRADIGARVTNLDMGISQEHLDALKAGLQRQLDISGIRMHGSTTLLQFGPETMNYQRVDGSTVYPAHLKFEIPSDARYIHKVLVSWKLGPYRAEVTGGTESEGHDHTGAAGAGGAFTPEVADGGAHTPTELSKAHSHDLDGTLKIPHASNIRWFPVATAQYESAVQALNHHHSNPSTGSSSSNLNACTSIGYGSSCASGACVDAASTYFHSVALAGHTHTQGNTGDTDPSAYIDLIEHNVVTAISDYVISIPSQNEDPAHAHTINDVAAHPHTGVYHGTHSDHVIQTAAASNVDLELGIIEVPGGTVMQLTVNGEDVTTVNGNGTDIVITGYCNTGSNTIELYPIVGSNTKGGATLEGRGILFIEAAKF